MAVKHVLSAKQFDAKLLEQIFILATKVRKSKYNKNALTGKIMATLFYEPSTRTRLSFESAMLRLGGKFISTENAAEFSSAAKGETIQDTIRVVNSYSDIIVLRHFKPGASEFAAKYSKVPIINAGDGEGEHPTQAILDLYTIFSKFAHKNIQITMIGDLTYGRTVHSLSQLLSLYPGIKLVFCSPKALAIPSNLKSELSSRKIDFEETEDFRMSIKSADVIYQA